MASCLADISVTYDYIIRLLNLSSVDRKKNKSRTGLDRRLWKGRGLDDSLRPGKSRWHVDRLKEGASMKSYQKTAANKEGEHPQ